MSNRNLSDNQIIDILKEQKPEVGKSWQESTEHKLMELINSDVTFNQRLRTEWRNLIFNLTAVTKKRALMFGVLGVLSIGLIGGGLWGYNRFRNGPLSAEQQREILNKVIASNAAAAIRSPQTVALETTTLSTRSAAGDASLAADSAQILPLPVLPPGTSDYNYRHSKNTYSTGPAATKCTAFSYAGVNNQYESYEFSDQQGTNYYKSISTDENGQMLTYSLSKNTPSGNEYYEYRGGQFAVKTVTTYSPDSVKMEGRTGAAQGEGSAPDATSTNGATTPADAPIAPDVPTSSEPAPTDDPIKQYFGENAQVKSTVQENGQEYYLIEYIFPVNCNEAIYLYRAMDTAATYTNNVIYQSWVNTKDFIVYKSFSYLDSVNDANLIDSSTQTGETRNTDFASVSGDFNFDYNVPVRTLDTSLLTVTPEQEAKNTADYLATLNVDVVLINHPTLKVNSISSYNPDVQTPKGWDYYTDRTYYPAGAKGDEMYADATRKPESTSNYVNPQVSINAYDQTTYKYLTMEGYTNSFTEKQLLDNRFSSDYTIEGQQSLTWTVKGQSVTVTLYTLKIKTAILPFAAEGGSDRSTVMPVEPGYVCEGADCTYTEKIATFTYGNTKYMVSLTQDMDVNSLRFDSYNTKNSVDMDFLRAKILELRQAGVNAAARAEELKRAAY